MIQRNAGVSMSAMGLGIFNSFRQAGMRYHSKQIQREDRYERVEDSYRGS